MKMLNFNRIIVVVIGAPVLIYSYLSANKSGIPFLILINCIILFGLNEFYNMLIKAEKKVYRNFGLLIGILIPNIEFISWKYPQINLYNLDIQNILILAFISLLIYRVISNRIEGSLEILSLTMLGIVYVSVFFTHLIKIARLLPEPGYLLLLIQFLVWACDTGAGLIGVAIGRKIFKKGFTKISPNKSVEGAIGGIITTAILMIVFLLIRDRSVDRSFNSLLISCFIAIIIAIVAEIGDLVESLFKRETNIKDSGTILKGHGGVLDRFDSMLLVAPFVYYFILFFGIKYL